ncbi:uncharacterized protein LOC119680809 [Teleopsis dalmanni]|uniref:uncharacterized protein LOC119680809 n=1 Tax=Teleopsis dalmanni TaxID=139649 RepID=UPI0018CE54EA|nr:uncharacterized protein LOC119680809 [Teleopsis dalmanni]
MIKYTYLDVQLKLQDDTDATLTPAYFLGSINNSLKSLFGEIGGQTELEIIEFSIDKKRGIIKVPSDYNRRVRSAIALIGYYQDIRCHFRVFQESSKLLNL